MSQRGSQVAVGGGTRAGDRPRFGPATRRLVLTVHIVSSVGWIGVYFVLLALVVTGLTASDPGVVRAVYVVVQIVDAKLTVPLTVLMLVSGIVLSLGTKWGLVRYRWVLVKVAITVALTALVLGLLQSRLATAAAAVSAVDGGLPPAGGPDAVIPPIVAITAALVATVLSVYKPWGRTPWARRNRTVVSRTSRTSNNNASSNNPGSNNTTVNARSVQGGRP